MSIYEETVAATKFDPTAAGPSVDFDGWDDLIPNPSVAEMVENFV